jgi:hypothetical protein
MSCGRPVAAGDPVWWDATASKPVCTECHDAPSIAVIGTPEHNRRTGRSEGERRFLRILDGLDRRQNVVLHNRIARDSKLIIDHLVICSRGVLAIEAQLKPGRVVIGDVRRWGGTDPRLFVDGKDCSHLLSGIRRQAVAVRDVLRSAIPVLPTVCFVDADLQGFTRPLVIEGVRVTPTAAIHQLVAKEGSLNRADVERVAAILDAALPGA